MAQPGLVSGESMKQQPQTEEDLKAAEQTAIDAANTVGRLSDVYVVELNDGTKVKCRVAKVGQIGLVLRFLRDVAEKLEITSTEASFLDAKLAQLGNDPLLLLLLIERAETYLWPLVVALSDIKDVETAKDMDIDDAVKVGKALFALNKDFFLKRVLPLLQGKVSVK